MDDIDIDLDAEERKAHTIVCRFLDRQQERLVPPLLMFAVIEQGIKRLLTMGDRAEARAIVEEMLAEAAAALDEE